MRQIGYHVVQTYIPRYCITQLFVIAKVEQWTCYCHLYLYSYPSTVFVVLAWLSLFVPAESVPGRVGMGMTTLLTLTAMFSAVR